MRYSDIVGVEKHFKSAFDITSDGGDTWKTFISNEKFENNMGKIINCFTSPVYNNRNSVWIQGTYGTGKSHSLAVIKHLLCDDFHTIEDYLPRLNKTQLRSSITNFRKEKKVFPVVLKGIYAITDVADLTYVIQQRVLAALKDKGIEISTKTDFQSVLQILSSGTLDSFFDNLLANNIELHSYASNKAQLTQVLEDYETKVIRIIADELKRAGLGGFRTHSIIEWLTEIKKELAERGIADYLMIFWDEFTSLLDIPARRSILNAMQDIAELSKTEVDQGTDTLGVYLLIITHKRLEQTESYRELKEDERTMAKARFIELDYDMQPTTTYHILAGALDRKQPAVLEELRQKNLLDIVSVRKVVDQVVDGDAPNATEVKNKIISLYPFHPYTSYLATFVSRVVGEAERSIFGFLNDEDNGFKKFIKNEIGNPAFVTADYVWDFFYNTFETSPAGHFDAITNKYKLVIESVEAKGDNYVSVFKTILLLNILYRMTTTDADSSEKNMVNPSTGNIIAAFSGTIAETRVKEILDDIDDAQILHRNPDGVFEVASSALPQKKILEEKKKLYPNKEDVSKILEEYSIKCLGKLKTSISRNIFREVDVQVFWGGEKEHILKGRVEAKFKASYNLHVALIVYRGVTHDLDEILGRTESKLGVSQNMILRISKEPEFQNIVFVASNTELGNKRFEAYMDSLAQEAVARSLQMDEERIEGQKNAEKWITQWVDDIINSGMVDLIFRGDILHVPFLQCNKYLKDNYINTIFRYGLDSLAVPNTVWNHQTSKKAVELVLYSLSKSSLEQEAKGNDGAVKYLLSFDNALLFDEALTLISDDEKIPVVKVCKEVQRKIESKKNEPSINLAEELRFLTKPEYGYYQNRLFMGALAFALKPYCDRLYTSGNGQRIDKTVMKEVVVSIFIYWEGGKYNDKFIVRMSTEEERELTEKLNAIFCIKDREGLLGTKWAIRDKFKSKNKAPLWALKHVGSNTDKYCEFIDKLFKFSKSTDENILQAFIIDLLEGIKTFDVEISNAISSVESETCLDAYILSELKKIREDDISLPAVKSFLNGKMSGDIVFWEESDIHEQILLWKIKKKAEEESQSNNHSSKTSEDGKVLEQGNEVDSDTDNNSGTTSQDDFKKRAEDKLLAIKTNGEKLYDVIMVLMKKYSNIAEEVDNLL